MDTRELVGRVLLFMHVFTLGSSFNLSESSSPLLSSTITPIWATIFLVLTKFHIVQRPSLDVFFHSNTTYLEPIWVVSNLYLSSCWNYNFPYQVEKQCYQTRAFLSLLLLCARFQVRLHFAFVAHLVGPKDWFPPPLFLDAAPQN